MIDKACFLHGGQALINCSLAGCEVCLVRWPTKTPPVGVAALRPHLAGLIGMPGRRPDIVTRIGYGPTSPLSPRRLVEAGPIFHAGNTRPHGPDSGPPMDELLNHCRCALAVLAAHISEAEWFAAHRATWRAIDYYRRGNSAFRTLLYSILLPSLPLLPLNRPRRLRGDVVDDAVDAADFVDDAGGGGAEEGHVVVVEIRRHAVDRGDGA